MANSTTGLRFSASAYATVSGATFILFSGIIASSYITMLQDTRFGMKKTGISIPDIEARRSAAASVSFFRSKAANKVLYCLKEK